ncbi:MULTISPECIES: hypothetical protein [Pseudomonas]|nr:MULTISPECIES: hypothetical protein [Pseudomonas]WSO27381.1 hypothetical protein VUJ50_11590 [Pseudomonas fluorescens]
MDSPALAPDRANNTVPILKTASAAQQHNNSLEANMGPHFN